jgi:hypothetical protein
MKTSLFEGVERYFCLANGPSKKKLSWKLSESAESYKLPNGIFEARKICLTIQNTFAWDKMTSM